MYVGFVKNIDFIENRKLFPRIEQKKKLGNYRFFVENVWFSPTLLKGEIFYLGDWSSI